MTVLRPLALAAALVLASTLFAAAPASAACSTLETEQEGVHVGAEACHEVNPFRARASAGVTGVCVDGGEACPDLVVGASYPL